MERGAKIYIAGHTGLVGSAIMRKLKSDGYTNLLVRTHKELDLTKQGDVESFFNRNVPKYVIIAAAKVGGIQANSLYPAQFIYDNFTIQINIIHSAYLAGVKKLLFFGSACSYPRDCEQPMKEKYLLSGALEPTNEAYAVAKIAGVKMCQAYNKQYKTNFISAILTNAYGEGDNFDLNDSHVIPSLIRKFHEAKERNLSSITVWGTGRPRREFIFSSDAASAALFLMNNYDGSEIINIGVDRDIAIKDLIMIIKDTVAYTGEVIFNSSKPDGMPQKFLDSSRLHKLGWQAKISLAEGVKRTYNWYLKQTKACVS